jgi:hypothetical protein
MCMIRRYLFAKCHPDERAAFQDFNKNITVPQAPSYKPLSPLRARHGRNVLIAEFDEDKRGATREREDQYDREVFKHDGAAQPIARPVLLATLPASPTERAIRHDREQRALNADQARARPVPRLRLHGRRASLVSFALIEIGILRPAVLTAVLDRFMTVRY